MYCHRCGYSLAHLPTNRCPECGEPFDPADPATFADRDSPRFLRAWMHPSLVTVVSATGFLGGAVLGLYVGIFLIRAIAATGSPGPCVTLLIAPVCLFGGGLAGLAGLSLAVILFLPVDCPRCHGPAFYEFGTPVRYRCARCGHVHDTPGSRR